MKEKERNQNVWNHFVLATEYTKKAVILRYSFLKPNKLQS